jgi:arylformamidase
MAAGASVNVSSITMSPHVGTHADAPVHVTLGANGADALPLHPFHGPALVVDISDIEGAVPLEMLAVRFTVGTPVRLLLKTGRSIAGGTFPDRWPFLTSDCARALVSQGMILLGVDCPSVDDRNSQTLEAHHALFDAGAFVLENLDLTAVKPGTYELIAYPTKFVGLDAAPVRAVLRAIE